MPKDRHKGLVNLGADTLASALLDLSIYSKDADALVERLLSSSKEKGKSFLKRLSNIKRRHSYISWAESGAVARELADLLKELEMAETDAKAGVASVSKFYEADEVIFENCDDSSGRIGQVFTEQAAQLFVAFASRCQDKEWVLGKVISLYADDKYGVRSVLLKRMSEYLSEPMLRQGAERMWTLARSAASSYKRQHWIFALADLATQLKDPFLLESVRSFQYPEELPDTAIIEIARLCLSCGQIDEALTWVERIPVEQGFLANERDELLSSIYRKQKSKDKLAETYWRSFRRSRGIRDFERLIKAIGEDKRASVLKTAAAEILSRRVFKIEDVRFLIDAGCLDEAERYVVDRAKAVKGDFYPSLSEISRDFVKFDKLVAAIVLYRAMLDAVLVRAKSINYHNGVNYLKKLDSLAPKVKDWMGIETHARYCALLRQRHKLKSSFWSQYNG